MKWILRVEREIQTELDNIQICPAPCEEGTVLVSPPSGTRQRRRCPLLSFGCPYGSGVEEKLDGYLNRLLLGSGVPQRHIKNFAAYIETPALLCANKWGFGGFLVFFGKSGVGKSFGAAWAAKRYLRSMIPDLLDTKTWNRAANAGENTVWATVNRLIRDKSAISSSCAARLLVMDDLGREGDFPTRRADASDIVSARYDMKLPTIVTTELTFGEIIAAYGENTAFKLVEDIQGETSGGMLVDCGDVSLRPDNDGLYCEEKSVQRGRK
jgi:DNA replication protein DnaC